MLRYVSIFSTSLSMAIRKLLIYRFNFVMMLIQNLLHSYTVILSIELLFIYISDIAGVSKAQAIVIICSALTINGMYRGVFRPNLLEFLNSIHRGNFDFNLLKPISIQYQIMIGKFDFPSLCSIVLPMYIMSKYIEFYSLYHVLMYSLLILIGTLLIALIMLIIFSLSFIFINVQKLDETYYTLASIFEKPKEIYSKSILFWFLYFIPLVPIANTPANFIMGNHSSFDIFLLLGITLIYLMLATLVLKWGIKKYEGASN